MPAREGLVKPMHLATMAERLRMPSGCQHRWYVFAAQYVKEKTVLDVGAGNGYGLPLLLAGGAALVDGIDPLPVGQVVTAKPIEDVDCQSYDCVTAMDVIEHVDADRDFLICLLRTAKELVILSTPNWRQWGCSNQHHYREYTPAELRSVTQEATDASESEWSVEFWLSNISKDLSVYKTDPLRDDENAANFGVVLQRK